MRNKQKKAHFIGLCGKGMSGVARLLQESGWEVTGSDAGFYDPIKSYIEHCGLDCMTPHAKQNIPEDVDAIIIGRHAKLIPEHNEEVKHAFEHFADKIRSYPEILEDMTENTTNFVVTGSYGKSTITALLTWILISNKIDTSYMIGALPF
ncbi:MAG: UDP-N-acetylmuramate: L-alanyl-gamma-D-glutamyl-meso-diaminopimelate ligase, partial [Flavobacteriaceae bacterium]